MGHSGGENDVERLEENRFQAQQKGAKQMNFLLTEIHIQSLLMCSKTRGWMVWAWCMLSWRYLLRIQSESVIVFNGSNGNDIAKLAHRQNGLYFEDGEEKVLCFRMKSRKNRTNGS